MGTKRRIVAVNRELVTNFVNDGASDVLTWNEGGDDLEATLDVAVRLGGSIYSTIQHAISFLYRQSGIERLAELKGGISLYSKGSNRKGTQLKQDIGLKISEVKKPMSQEVFIFLAKKLFTSKKKERVFAHLFLMLDW